MVLGLCRLLLRDPVEAEDAAQQVFLSAHQAILRGSPPRDEAAWVVAIAVSYTHLTLPTIYSV